MQDQRDVDALGDGLEQVELQVRGPLVGAMAGAHGDRQAIHAGGLDERRGLLGMQIGITGLGVLVALTHMPKLGLDGHAHSMRRS